MTDHLRVKKPFLVVAWIGILSAIVGLCVNLYWLTYPYPGLVLDPPNIVVSEREVPSGELLTYVVNYCVDGNLPLPITVNREMELQNDGTQLAFPIAPPIAYEITERCETRRLFVGVPAYLPAGRYHIHAHTSLEVNPVRSVRQEFISNDFMVIK